MIRLSDVERERVRLLDALAAGVGGGDRNHERILRRELGELEGVRRSLVAQWRIGDDDERRV